MARLTGSSAVLLVADIERSVEYYRDRLGFTCAPAHRYGLAGALPQRRGDGAPPDHRGSRRQRPVRRRAQRDTASLARQQR